MALSEEERRIALENARASTIARWSPREVLTANTMHDVLTGPSVGAQISSMTFSPNGDTTVGYEIPVGHNGNRAPVELRPNEYVVANTAFSTQDVVGTPQDRVKRRVRGEILGVLRARRASGSPAGRRVPSTKG